MSAANENHEPVQNVDHHDRLMDAALAEAVGGQAPPELSSRIMAAVEAARLAKPQPVAVGNYARRFKWISVAVAASLLIGVGYLISGPKSNHGQSTPIAMSHTELRSQDKQTLIVKHVEEFNRLRDEQRYAEMETVARRLNELAPDDPVAQQVWLNTKFIRRELISRGLADDKEQSTWNQLSAVEQSAINPTTTDGHEVAYDTKHWDDFVKNRKGSKERVLEQSAPGGPEGGPSPTSLSLDASQPQSEPGGGRMARPRGSDPKHESELLAQSVAGTELGSKQKTWDVGNPTPVPAAPWFQGSINDAEANKAALATDPARRTDKYGYIGPRDYKKQLAEQIAQPNTTASTASTPSAYYLSDDVQLKQSVDQPVIGPVGQTIASNARDRLMMAVTPGIIIQEEDEERLGIEMQRPGIVEGIGPRSSGDKYVPIVENPFIKAIGGEAVSTFSIDVDTASYSNVRQFLMESNQLPPADAVRIEELVNYFDYDYTGPAAPGSAGVSSDDAPFAAHVEVATCPWNAEHRLARIAVKGREMDREKRPQSNLVFLVDVSGSMNEPAKLPLVVYGLERLTKELGENDHIAIVVYAGTEGLALPSTSGTKQKEILAALGKLQAGGSTAGGAGIQLAYQIAEDNFIKGGTNRVILCTDGDFNVGVTSTTELQKLVESKAKDTGVFLSVLGFGRGNLNDAMMETIADHGNGNYHYVDNKTEARRVLVEQMTGTLVTIAKDLKIQVEFNPAKVSGYRLVGYENRMLRTEDFNDDKKDAGEIGAGHTVTALYEIVPTGKKVDVAPVDDLKYQKAATADAGDSTTPRPQPPETSDELLTLKMRYKAPDGDTSKKLEWPVKDDAQAFADASDDYQFAAAVAGFGLVLRDSQYKGNLKLPAVLELAQGGLGRDEKGYRSEFLDMVRKAQQLKSE